MRANSRMSERCLPTSHVLCAGDGKERRWKGASQICRDQDGKSLIRISGRDSRGTYLRFHTSTRTSARAWMHMSCATETPEYACKPCHSAVIQCARIPKQVCMQSHATHHLFLLLSTIYIYLLFLRGRTHTRMHSFSADALSICQLIMLWQQKFQHHVLHEHVLSASHKSICCMSCEATV